MSHHTRGIWGVHRSADGGIESIVANGKQLYRAWPFDGCTDQQREANARLITAAPEMLEALKNIENDDGHIPAPIWGLRNAAIAKAEGRIEDLNTRETEQRKEQT